MAGSRGAKVTAIGHSDGGVTAAALAFNTNAGDPRVGAGIIISGDYGEFGGEWFPDGLAGAARDPR